mmetsp:Transcript_111833/g.193904  ORF Transcript_111833/g.193904 Transcript_111833/m.193904 type:complete len:200 (+) Transcript_111833:286-885(+)
MANERSAGEDVTTLVFPPFLSTDASADIPLSITADATALARTLFLSGGRYTKASSSVEACESALMLWPLFRRGASAEVSLSREAVFEILDVGISDEASEGDQAALMLRLLAGRVSSASRLLWGRPTAAPASSTDDMDESALSHRLPTGRDGSARASVVAGADAAALVPRLRCLLLRRSDFMAWRFEYPVCLSPLDSAAP